MVEDRMIKKKEVSAEKRRVKKDAKHAVNLKEKEQEKKEKEDEKEETLIFW